MVGSGAEGGFRAGRNAAASAASRLAFSGEPQASQNGPGRVRTPQRHATFSVATSIGSVCETAGVNRVAF
jgi:hypothetical protein